MESPLYELKVVAEILHRSGQLTTCGYEWLMDYCEEIESTSPDVQQPIGHTGVSGGVAFNRAAR